MADEGIFDEAGESADEHASAPTNDEPMSAEAKARAVEAYARWRAVGAAGLGNKKVTDIDKGDQPGSLLGNAAE